MSSIKHNVRFSNGGYKLIFFILFISISYNICACTYTITLYDSYFGCDGWNYGKVTVKVNGVPVLTDLTLVSSCGPESYYFNVNAGDNITTVYTSGSYSNENWYEIYDSNSTLVIQDGDNTQTITPSGISITASCSVGCTTPGTPVANNPSGITGSGANFSWTGGSPLGSPTVTYYWAVGISSTVTYESGYTDRGTTTSLSVSTSSLSPNTTYYFRLKACTDCNSTCSNYTSYKQFTSTASDPCSSVISISGCGSGYEQTFTGGGTGTWASNSCYSSPGSEQIYSFVAPTTGTYSIQVSAASGYVDYLWKASSCSSSGWTCISDITSTGNYGSMSWTAGTTYYILLDDENSTTGTHKFYINCPAGDPCASVISIGGCGSGYEQTFTGGGTGAWASNSCYSSPGSEQIYSFVAPTTGTYSIQVTAASGYVDYLWKASSCSSSGWTCISDVTSTGSYGSMSWTAGTTYYILLDDENSTTGTHKFYIDCPTMGEDCSLPLNISSLPFSSGLMSTCGFSSEYDSYDACGSYYMDGPDVVFKYIPSTTQTITASLSGTSAYTGLFITQGCPSSGSCVAFDESPSGDPSIPCVSLTGGQTYYFIVSTDSWSSSCTNFNLSVSTGSTTAPSNDDCANAINLSVGSTCNFVQYTNACATSSSVTAPPCGNYAGGDVWFRATMPASGNVNISTSPIDPYSDDYAMAVYSGSCGSLNYIACNDDYATTLNGYMPEIRIRDNSLAGQTIWIRIWSENNGNSGPFEICIYEPTAPTPCNSNPIASDNCSTATPICEVSEYCGNTGNFYSQDLPGNMCQGCGLFNGSIENNSWLSFEANATTASMHVSVSNCENGLGIQMGIYFGTNCNGFSLVSDINYTSSQSGQTDFTIDASSLTPGNTYYIMIDGYAGDICDYSITPVSGISTVDAGTDQCSTGSVQLQATGGISYTWTPSTGLSNPNIANPIATPGSTTTYTVTANNANSMCPASSDNVTVYVYDVLLNTTATNINCYGNNNGQATITVSNGSSPYSYSWSSSQTTQSISGLGAGTYTCTVTDSNNCSATSTITITEPSAINTSATQTNILCYGNNNGSATISVSGGISGYSYDWSPDGFTGDGTDTYSGLTSGTYTVTVTDANSCTSTETVIISQPSSALSGSITGSDVTTNGGTDGTADLTVSGGTSPNSYLWNTGTTTEDLTNISAGIYCLTVTDVNSCTTSVCVTISQPGSSILASIVGTDVSCYGGSDGSADLTVFGGTSPYSFSWSNGPTTEDISGLPAGVYTVTIIDNNSATTTASVVINQPVDISISIAVTNVSCNGLSDGSATASCNGGTSPYSYVWNTNPAQNAATATGLQQGTYTVTATDSLGCSSNMSTTITEPSDITASINTQTNVSCNGGNDGSAVVTAVGGSMSFNYAWSTTPQQTNDTATSLSAGVYTVTISDIDANNCAVTASVTITEPSALSASVSSTNETINGACDGTATVTPSGGTTPYTYEWDNNTSSQTTPTATNLCTGAYNVTVTDANGCTAIQSVNVLGPGSLNLVTTGSSVNCNGDCDGTASVNVTGGVSPYSYIWDSNTGNQSNNIATGLCAGTYAVTVTNNNGAMAISTATVSEPTAINVSVSSETDVLCYGENSGSVTIYATGGVPPYTYLWSDSLAQTSSTASSLYSGTYTVTVSDSNSCTATSMVTINQPAILSAGTSKTDILCFGGSTGSASVTISGGMPGYSYDWAPDGFNGDGTNTYSNLTAGTYTINIVDSNMCNTTATITIDQPAELSTTTAQLSPDCQGSNTGSATTSPSGGTSAYSYQWSQGQYTTQTITNVSGGYYYVVITDDNDCSITDSINITLNPLPVVNAGQDTSICANSSITLNAIGGISYAWNNNVTNGVPFTPGSTNTYIVTATDNYGCSNSDSVTVNVMQLPNVNIGNDTTICNGNALMLNAGNFNSFAWSNGSSSQTIIVSATGSYSVTVTNSYNCKNSDNISVAVNNYADATISSVSALCSNDEPIILEAVSTGGIWYGAGITDSITGTFTPSVSGSGNIQVYYTIPGECGSIDSIAITVLSAPVVSLQPTAISCIDVYDGSVNMEISNLTGTYAYIWNTGDTTRKIEDLRPGTYYVTVTGNNSCQTTGSAEVQGTNSYCYEPVIFLPNIFSPNGDGVNDVLYVRGKGIVSLDLVIFDRWGEKVFETSDVEYGWDGTYKGVEMNTSVFVYYLKAELINNQEIIKKGNITLIR